ncbi:hypothetical protein EXIGLDRAFT_737241 [Exidia glandulosa HHB12029]|uniref:Uncharacterized protein n=1 Tax=Exidia glandulosa HHB12029 TaxID=1314781 RepID=A0A165J2F9_EXIGL|nr:hypothetical protein EXIGLDRAFT_737241 [Exidia glandulosa HHB12029]
MDPIISHEASLAHLPSPPLHAFAHRHFHKSTVYSHRRTGLRGFVDPRTCVPSVGGLVAALAWADAASESGHTLAVLHLLLANDEYGALTRKTLKVPRLYGMVAALIRSVVYRQLQESGIVPRVLWLPVCRRIDKNLIRASGLIRVLDVPFRLGQARSELPHPG